MGRNNLTPEDIEGYIKASGYDEVSEESLPILIQSGYYKEIGYESIKNLARIMINIGYYMKDVAIGIEDLEEFKEVYLSEMLDKTIELMNQEGFEEGRKSGRTRHFRLDYDIYCSFCERVFIRLTGAKSSADRVLRMFVEYKTIQRNYVRKVSKLGEDCNKMLEGIIIEDMYQLYDFNRDVIELDEWGDLKT